MFKVAKMNSSFCPLIAITLKKYWNIENIGGKLFKLYYII